MEAKTTIKYNGNHFSVTVSGEREDVVETLIALSESNLLKGCCSDFALNEGELNRLTFNL